MRIFFTVIFIALLSASCTDSKSTVDDSEISDVNVTDGEAVEDDKNLTDNETVDDAQDDLSDDLSDIVLTESEVLDTKADESELSDNETVDEVQDDLPDDDSESETPDEDTSSSDHVEVINNTNGSVTVNVTLNAETDAVTSYLMAAASSSWNYFHGSSVNIGFRVYSVLDDQYVAYHSAFRFTDVDVPAGATIESAKFSFHPTNEVDSSQKVYLRAAMEKSVNSAEFDVSNYTTNRPDQRSETDATVEETLLKCIELDTCYDPESSYCKDRALDCWDREVRFTFRGELSDMVQEIIDTNGWAKKNAMTVFITGTYPAAMSSGEKPDYSNNRSVTGYDTDKTASYYPVLSITFTVK